MGKLLPQGTKRREFVKKIFFDPILPSHISRNFINLNDSDLELIKASLERNFFSKTPNGYLSTEVGKNDLLEHLTARLEVNRKLTIPWLDSVRSLRDSHVLEIGCGTGASTVALAEQGADVTAIDTDEISLNDAKKRCEVYGLNVHFHHMNSTEAVRLLSVENFDFIIFWACLEHMTHEERIIAIKGAWDILPQSGLLCVTDTPNRLHFYDSHTSKMPFFHWLPDDLAIRYSRFSPRQKFSERFAGYNGEPEYMLQFLRWGRGLSYHEFELAIKPVDQLNVVSSRDIFYRKRMFSFLKWRISIHYRYEYFLHKLRPNIHRGFFQPDLELIIKKD